MQTVLPTAICRSAARLAFLLTAAALTLGGCAALLGKGPEPVAVGQVIAMSQQGVPADQIIAKMRDSGTVYRLRASQLAKLKELGVTDAVIDYMQETYLDAVRRDQAIQDWHNWTLWNDGYWYGGCPFGWRWRCY